MTLEHKNSILNVATNYSELFGILLKLKPVTELIQTREAFDTGIEHTHKTSHPTLTLCKCFQYIAPRDYTLL